jgi:A/G-specific adenine glycosylase
MMDDKQRRHFQASVRDYYQAHGRHDLPWRQPDAAGRLDPYPIIMSEVMLQQTQVGRVIPKYLEFLRRFPTLQALAAAPLGEVLRAWSGLGYNRRAKFLREGAILVVDEYDGQVPRELAALIRLPGIGANTAGAILAYAFNQPAVFVETNIRTVFIHHFFDDEVTGITEPAIRQLVAETLDREQPREWYWALMDYGTYLKQSVGNLNVRGSGYSRQSRFQGSRRQVRGQVIRLLGQRPYDLAALRAVIDDERLKTVLDELVAERLIRQQGRRYLL